MLSTGAAKFLVKELIYKVATAILIITHRKKNKYIHTIDLILLNGFNR